MDDGSTNGTFVDGFEVFADPTKLRALNSANLKKKSKADRGKLNASSLAQQSTEVLSSLDRIELLVSSRSSNTNITHRNLISRGSTLQSIDTISDKNGTVISSSEMKTDALLLGDEYGVKHGVALKQGSLVTFGCAPGHPSGLSHLLYQLEIKDKPRY